MGSTGAARTEHITQRTRLTVYQAQIANKHAKKVYEHSLRNISTHSSKKVEKETKF